MSEFAKYEEMHRGGATPEAVYRAANADGLDEIARIRLLRTVCGLSLADAKRVTGSYDALNRKQEVREGATVYWEGADTVDGFYVMEARVVRVDGDRVRVTGHKKYLVTDAGLEEVPADGGLESLPVRYFDKTLAERLGESFQFWDDLARVSSRAG
ncbi:MAG TPA: hypothetical protein VGF55_08445 [Gemmataceae bacterium]|jgi:hypothetical protein